MRNFLLVLAFCCSSVIGWSQITYAPNSTNSITGGATYCQNVTPAVLSYTYNTCSSGSGIATGVALTISWYSNTVNSTSGGTLQSITFVSSSTAATGNTTFLPSTVDAGTTYYYCVITWDGTGLCNTSGILTSPTVAVNVNTAPGAITGTLSACVGTQSTLSNSEPGGTWTSATAARATITAGGVVSAVSAGTSVISYSIGSCRSTATFTVNANPSAVAGTNIICENATTTFTDATAGGTWTILDPSVASLAASTGSPVTITGLNSGATTISYTLSTGCYATRPLTVNNAPGPITGSLAACVGTQTTLGNTEPGGTWVSTTTTKATITAGGVVTAVAAGTSVISYSIGSCRSTATFTVNANPSTVAGTNVICENATTTFTDATAGGTWTILDPSVASLAASTGSPVTITGLNSGATTISYTLSTGCYATRPLTVNNAPGPITGSLAACVGTQTTLGNTEPGGTWVSTTTTKATITAGGVVTAIAAGTSVISYSIGSCRSTATFTVNANPSTVAGTNVICENATTTFTDATAGGTWTIVDPSVASLAASTGSPVTITGLNAGATTISYTLSTGCYATRPLTVNNAPGPITGTFAACVGTQTTLSNSEPGGTWVSTTTARATITADGVVSAVSAGTSVISYSIGSCRSTATFTVNANPSTVAGTNVICENATTTFTDATAGGTWTIVDPSVASLAASTGSPVTITGLNTGSTTISYTLSTGCYATRPLTVNNAPGPITGTLAACVGTQSTLSNSEPGGTWTSATVTRATITADGVVSAVSAGTSVISYTIGSCLSTATFSANANPSAVTGTNVICENATTTFTDVTTGGTWTIVDPSVASLAASTGVPVTITGLNAGATTISYTLSTGCYATRPITVNNAPGPITGTGSACTGTTATLANSEPGGTWTSATVGVATIASSGTVSAVSAGTSLISYTIGSCRSTLTFTVNSNPAAISGTQTVCRNAVTTFSDITAGGAWSTSDGSIASVDVSSPVNITGIAPGSAIISYTLPTGCFATRNVTVNQAPDAITGPTSLCSGTSTTFTNTIGGGTWASSATTKVTISATTGEATALTQGSATISYTIGSCRSLLPVTVEASPAAIGGTASMCVGASVTLTNTTLFGSWSTDNEAVATVNAATGVVTGVSAGTANITYATGCGADAVRTVTVNTTPTAITGTLNVCIGAATSLDNSVPGGTWSSTAAGVATISAGGVAYGVAAGNSTISYVIGSCAVSSTLTVNPNPEAITGTNAICNGTGTTFDNATADGTWSIGDELVATIDAATPLAITSVAVGNTTVSYTLATGCYAVRGLTVNPNPETITGTDNVCIGASTSFASATLGGTWSTSAPEIATVDALSPVNISGVTEGEAVISYTLGTGCYTTRSLTINPNPDAITGTDNVCPGASVTFANTTLGGSWSTSAPEVATIDGASPVNITGLSAGNAIISYTIGTGCYATRSLTVNPNPDAITGDDALCQEASTSYANATAGGTWSVSAPAIATIDDASPVNLSGLTAGTAVVSYTIGTGCYVVKEITVNVHPSAAITSASDACYNYATNIVVSGTSGATVFYKVDGGAELSTTLTGGTANINTGVITSAHSYQLTMVQTATCSAALDTTVNVDVIPMQWVGGDFAHETQWSRPANWSCGFVPGDTTDVTIPSGLTYYPEVLEGDFAEVKNLTVQSGATIGIDNAAILDVKGNMQNNGSFVGAGSVSFNGSSAQSISGLGRISNLQVANAAGVSIAASSRVTITQSVIMNLGTLTTNDSLVLYSDATTNARIAPMNIDGHISGNVKVMQYVPGGYRRYRFWSHPFSNTISLGQIQNYIDITGIGGSANGFTTTGSNNPSSFRYDTYAGNSSLSSDPGWKAFTKINSGAADSNLFHRYQGIRLFIRGTKGQGLGFISEIPNPVTISMIGTLNQGNQDIALSKGSSANQEYNMVGNPYASPVDIGTVIYNAKQASRINGSAFYVWDPFLGVGGAYITRSITNTPYYIQANTAFQVRAAYDGAQLNFTELNKGNDYDTLLLRAAPSEFVTLKIVDAEDHPWDYVRVAFNNNATSANDNDYDATKLAGTDFNCYTLSSDGEQLAIDARPFNTNDAIPVGINTSYAQQYTFKVEEAAVPAGKTLYLNDKLLGKSVEVVPGNQYTFNITKEAASQGNNRFELSAKPFNTVAKVVNVSLSPNPATDVVALSFSAPTAQQLNVRVMDVTGAAVYSQDLGITSSVTTGISLNNLPAGTYMVEVTYGKNKSVQKLVKE